MVESKYYSDLLPVVLVGLIFWLLGLTTFVYWIFKRFKQLGKGVGSGNLVKVLEKVLKNERVNKENIDEVNKQVDKISGDIVWHIQKMGLVRFNPFNETGGDQSFSLSLLDEKGDGIVLSCLHARDRTRVYAKPVKKGKSRYELSREEKKAISEAQRSKK